MMDISLESKDQLFLSIGILMLAAATSVISPYLGSEYKMYAFVGLVFFGALFCFFGFKIMNKKQKSKEDNEYLERKHRIADLILKKQQMTDQRDKNLIDGFIHEEQQKLSFGIATGVRKIGDSFEVREVPEQVLTSWKKILNTLSET
jgi:hypothetical protein